MSKTYYSSLVNGSLKRIVAYNCPQPSVECIMRAVGPPVQILPPKPIPQNHHQPNSINLPIFSETLQTTIDQNTNMITCYFELENPKTIVAPNIAYTFEYIMGLDLSNSTGAIKPTYFSSLSADMFTTSASHETNLKSVVRISLDNFIKINSTTENVTLLPSDIFSSLGGVAGVVICIFCVMRPIKPTLCADKITETMEYYDPIDQQKMIGTCIACNCTDPSLNECNVATCLYCFAPKLSWSDAFQYQWYE